MPTLVQRNSDDLLSTNATNTLDNGLPTNATQLATEPKYVDTTKDAGAQDDDSTNMRRLAEFMDAWSQGLFNAPEAIDEALAAFFTKDVVLDVASANAHVGVPEMREYSYDTLKDWFAYLAEFNLSDVVVKAVPSSWKEFNSEPSQVWQQLNCVATSKATGRSAHVELLNVLTFEGAKVKRNDVIYADPGQHAYLRGLQETPAEVKMPVFEPHPNPMTVYEKALAAWSSGEFAKAETKQAAFDELIKPNIILDASSAVLPDVFKMYLGHEGVDQWANGVLGTWEFTNMELTPEVGLKPGCVMQRLECDVTHAGKEVKGIVIYVELAYDADGKAVYQKHFWANPKVAAALYTKDC